jgi:hypothetical protein
MQKTGESYTAARSRLLQRRVKRTAAPPPPTPRRPSTPASIDYAKLAGMSDAALKKATGCDWAKWVWALDRVEAYTWPHRKIADHVHEKYKVKDWWTQTVTVGYERIKGLREIGQRRGGGFEASKSKTFGVAVTDLFHAFADSRKRRGWLDGVELTVKSATAPKRMRIAWPDQSVVEVTFAAKGAAKSSVAIQHGKLPDRATSLRMKEFWTDRLTALGSVLASA